jgi:ammonia channel protein AmtB
MKRVPSPPLFGRMPLLAVFGIAFRNVDFCGSFLVTLVSGFVAFVMYLTVKEHDLRQFYSRHNKVLLAVYVLCVSIIWLSLVFNARFICTHFLGLLFSPST